MRSARRLDTLLGVACAIAAVTFAPSASAKSADAFPPVLQKNMACMAEVLRFIVGVDHIKIGVWDGPNMPFHADEQIDDVPWRRPYLEYRFVLDRRRPEFVQINIERSRIDGPESYEYTIVLNGLFSPPDRSPPDLGTREAVPRWKAQCGVDVSVMTV